MKQLMKEVKLVILPCLVLHLDGEVLFDHRRVTKNLISRYFLITGLIILITGLFTLTSQAQTCCSGGVPMAGNVGSMAPADKGTFQLSIGFDGNFLRTLKEGTETISDHSRFRTTYSGLLNAYYSINDRLSVEGLFSFVRQERDIRQGEFNDFTSTMGPGDIVFLLNYAYLSKDRIVLRAGAGPKFPTGPSDLKNNDGITLNADLQPGSGAMDIFFNHMFSLSPGFRPASTIVHTITYRVTGENPAYLGSQRYSFGNELHMSLGISEQDLVGKMLMSYGLNIRYRHASRDIINGHLLPNTGGQWIFLMPSVSWHISSRAALNISSELPLYSRVDGNQLTPTFRLNAGLYLKIGPEGDLLPGF